MTQGITIPFVQEPTSCFLGNHKLTEKQSIFVDKEIKGLLKSGRVSAAKELPKCVVPIGCVPKKNKQLRMIVDLRHVNSFCKTPKFRYEDVSFLQQVIKTGDKLVKIDLKDAFHNIPVSSSSSQFLGFEWKKVIYNWNVCPFGLSYSPYFFVKTLRPCVEFLRSKGIRLLCYMDDFLIAAAENYICEHRDLVLYTLKELGWCVNYEKSSLEPRTCTEFLGFMVDSLGKNGLPELSIPGYKIKKIIKRHTSHIEQRHYYGQTIGTHHWAL